MSKTNTASLELNFKTDSKISHLVLREHIAAGQRVKELSIEAWQNGKFVEVSRQTTIGHKRILPLNVTTSKIRINIIQSKAPAVLQEIEIY